MFLPPSDGKFDFIRDLDDADALHILNAVVHTHIQADPVPWTQDLRTAINDAFELDPEVSALSDGALAREALRFLAADPHLRNVIEAIALGPRYTRKKFDALAAVSVVTAVLMALQTNIKFERDKQGKWDLKIEKKATSETLLKELVQKLFARVPKE